MKRKVKEYGEEAQELRRKVIKLREKIKVQKMLRER